MRFLQDKFSVDIWKNKYQHEEETVDEWFKRVSNNNEKIEKLMREGKFLFGGRILSNRGLGEEGKKITYSNCYVLDVEDSIESIYQAHSDLARTFSAGGGVGIDISKLRPKGAKVNNAAKTTSGAVSFMPSFSQVAEIIAQNGRRGALMLSMSCEHPDIEEFIDVKANSENITKANISVRITDDFMTAVMNELPYECKFKLENGKVITKTVDANKLFRKLCENNWNYAEPGMLFWDRIEDYNLLQYDENFKFAGVNPCAEEPLPNGGSCLLGSINLSAYVENGEIDITILKDDVEIIVEAMNDVLDEGLSLHPLQIQRDTVRDYRQIGIGVMGIADMLIKLETEYGSQHSINICDIVGREIANSAIKSSVNLAKKYGAYPKYTTDVLESEFFEKHTDNETKKLAEQYGLRNSQLLTIAPTGSISNLLGISGGIEPIFANSYTRKTESLHGEDVYYQVYTPIVKEYMDLNDISDELELPKYFTTAVNLKYEDRIKMQSVWQSHIDASISSTINLPNEATIEDVYNIYISAWLSGLKGVTIYRQGCKREGILTTKPKEATTTQILERGSVDNIPIEQCIAKGRKLTTGCGTLWMTAYFSEDKKLQHIFLDKGSKGGCNSFMCGLSRMISLSARLGGSVEDIVDQLQSTVTCNSYFARTLTKKDASKGNSCPSAVGIALKEMFKEFNCNEKPAKMEKIENQCPVCGSELKASQGCFSCEACGYSKCDL